MWFRQLFFILPDRLYIDLQYFKTFRQFPNWNHPKTFCEKIQWLKVNYKNPLLPTLVDKFSVKDYVSQVIGKQYIIPTLGTWNNPEEIPWNDLPNRFVLKTTHGGGNNGVVIVNDKDSVSRDKIIDKLKIALRHDSYHYGREWPYKFVKKQIIAEQNINNDCLRDIIDYKFYCFNGAPLFCQVIRNRSSNETIDFFNMEWQLQPFVGLSLNAKNSETPISKPKSFEEMKEIARALSDKFPFVRVDLYEVGEKVYFGEMTFYPGSGIGRFKPEEWEIHLGDLLDISKI